MFIYPIYIYMTPDAVHALQFAVQGILFIDVLGPGKLYVRYTMLVHYLVRKLKNEKRNKKFQKNQKPRTPN